MREFPKIRGYLRVPYRVKGTIRVPFKFSIRVWSCRKLGGTYYFGVLTIRILLLRGLY